MAVKMIGDAMQEFQEQLIFSYTPLETGGVLEALGLNPTVEAVAAQLAVIAFAVLTFVLLRRRNSRTDVQRA
jgi:high-affinity iron transporter